MTTNSPSLTIVTAVLNTRGGFLSELAESIYENLEPLALSKTVSSLSWRIQVDGDGVGPDFTRLENTIDRMGNNSVNVTFGRNGRQKGAAVTRNIALDAVPADLAWAVDEDDVVLPAAVNLFNTLANQPSLSWAIGGLIVPKALGYSAVAPLASIQGDWEDVLTRYRLEPQLVSEWVDAPPLLVPGIVPIGSVMKAFDALGAFPVTGNCAAFRSDAIWEAGGWPATPTGEDAGLLLNVSARRAGTTVPGSVIAYRRHESQNTATSAYQELRMVSRTILTRMANAANKGLG